MGKKVMVGIATGLLLFAAGCSTSSGEVESSNTEIVTIVDSNNNEVEVPQNPSKIAAFDNGQIDNLDALGLGDRISVTASSNIPEHLNEYAELPIAGTLHEVDLETTYEVNPELAIVAGRSRSSFDGLSEFVPTIDLSNNSDDYFSSIQTNLGRYGQIFGLEEEAEELTTQLENQMNQLSEDASSSGLSTLFVMFNEGSLSAYGPGSRFGFVHDNFGFEPVDENVEASNHGMEISYEYILEQDPDVLFVLDRTSAIGGDQTSETLEENPLLQQTTAYENDNIVYLSPDVWYLSEGGAQAFQMMMDEVSTVLE